MENKLRKTAYAVAFTGLIGATVYITTIGKIAYDFLSSPSQPIPVERTYEGENQTSFDPKSNTYTLPKSSQPKPSSPEPTQPKTPNKEISDVVNHDSFEDYFQKAMAEGIKGRSPREVMKIFLQYRSQYKNQPGLAGNYLKISDQPGNLIDYLQSINPQIENGSLSALDFSPLFSLHQYAASAGGKKKEVRENARRILESLSKKEDLLTTRLSGCSNQAIGCYHALVNSFVGLVIRNRDPNDPSQESEDQDLFTSLRDNVYSQIVSQEQDDEVREHWDNIFDRVIN
ncbi:hypothetical protein ACFLZX_04010 [Nanoarchaeota archaeon]